MINGMACAQPAGKGTTTRFEEGKRVDVLECIHYHAVPGNQTIVFTTHESWVYFANTLVDVENDRFRARSTMRPGYAVACRPKRH